MVCQKKFYSGILSIWFLGIPSVATSANNALDTLIGNINETLTDATSVGICNVNPYLGAVPTTGGWGLSPTNAGCVPTVASCPNGKVAVPIANSCSAQTTTRESSALSLAQQQVGSSPDVSAILTNVGTNPYPNTKNSVSCPADYIPNINNPNQGKVSYNQFCFVKVAAVSAGPFYVGETRLNTPPIYAIPTTVSIWNSRTNTSSWVIGLQTSGYETLYFDQNRQNPVTVPPAIMRRPSTFQCFTYNVTATARCIPATSNVQNFARRFFKN